MSRRDVRRSMLTLTSVFVIGGCAHGYDSLSFYAGGDLPMPLIGQAQGKGMLF